MVCYITVSGFLNGPGFQKMRDDLRRSCDDIWIIDCSPEGHRPEVSTRIFQGVQHPVCIVLASRSPANDPTRPARAKFRALSKGRREAKFAELAAIGLDSKGWSDCPSGWREPFLPSFSGGWGDYVALESAIGDCGSGVMPGRTWVIAPDAESLQKRWEKLVSEKDRDKRASLFHPHQGGDKTITKTSAKGLTGHHKPITDIEFGITNRDSPDESIATEAESARSLVSPTRYGFRSFDRQWIIPDNRVINRPNPGLWENHSLSQIYLTAPMDRTPSNGPALTAVAVMPDLHHYNGRGGRVFALWKDADASQSNISAAVVTALTKAYGAAVDPADVFAYIAALLAYPAYAERFRDDLIRPGLRVPLTADAELFKEAAILGREVLWLHTFGEQFNEGKPAGTPRLPSDRRPGESKAGAISAKPEEFPDAIEYDAAANRLKIGTGYIDRVPPAVWAYEVSGMPVLRQWFSYRKSNRERPHIGDRRKPSPLGDIQPNHWLHEYTSELINVLNVLGMLVDLEPKQADLLRRVCDGPLIPASKFT